MRIVPASVLLHTAFGGAARAAFAGLAVLFVHARQIAAGTASTPTPHTIE
jgi:hypothetical protein